jgi:hexosaminidase
MGSRLKSVHIADGDGEDERHYFPCSGQGKNDWIAILAALDKVGYKGPFMFESKYENVKSFKECYRTLYQNYINSIK